MKKNILLYMAAVAGLILAGCNKTGTPEVDPLAMTVKASIGDQTKVAYDGVSTTFQTGDQLAVWAWTGESDVLPQTFVVDGIVNTLDESGKWVPATQMLWKNVQDEHYFLAVHPVPASAIADLSAVPYAVDNTNYEASDLLLATELDGLKAASGTVDLAFTHAMAKLQVNLKFRNQFGSEGPAAETVSAALVGKSAAKVNYLTKAVTPTGNEGPVALAPMTEAATGYAMSFSGLQIPQKATKIVVTVGETTFSYTHPEPLPIEPGKVTTLGFNVGQNVILLESVTVTNWVEDDPITGGEAELETEVNLSELTTDYVAQDGETLVGTLGANVKISIADGATVTLDGVTINGVNEYDFQWAGLNCVGDATIILKDGTTNTVKGFYDDWPGIHVPGGSTLTIQGETLGTGKLIASSNGYGCGIGGGWNIANDSCGNINIEGGNITATGAKGSAGIGGGNVQSCGAISITGGIITSTGGENGAGIGSAFGGSCVSINISGGTVTATGGANAAGIGGGGANGTTDASCGDITITSGVTKVTAQKGSGASNSIGAGKGTCGTVTIGGVVYPDGVSESPFVYHPLTYPVALSEVTSAYVGSVIASNGMVYATASKAADAGTTAVAIITYVGSVGSVDASSETYKGLALALADANGGNKAAWSSVAADCLDKQYGYGDDPTVDMSGIANTDTLVSDGHDHDAASAARNYNGGTYPAGTSKWFLPSAGQWQKMITAAGSYANLVSNANLKSENDPYWSSTEKGNGSAWTYAYGNWDYYGDTSFYVRACLAF
jgi:hypothetical protein